MHRKEHVSRLARVYGLMSDNQEHTIDEVREVGGSSGDRRLRELSEEPFNLTITRTRIGGWTYTYRMLAPDAVQHERICKHLGLSREMFEDYGWVPSEPPAPVDHGKPVLTWSPQLPIVLDDDKSLTESMGTLADTFLGRLSAPATEPRRREDRPLDEIGGME